MIVANSREELRAHLNSSHGIRGFVPTMGALHEGHLSLVRESKRTTSHTVVSIFVNPAQFNDSTDLEKYPRNIERDLEMLSGILGPDDLVYTPQPEDIYRGEQGEEVDIELGDMGRVMEGEFRPGHFRGVVKVVNLLFDIIRPDRAFFGEKDFQQLAVVRKLASLLHQDVEITGCPILREPNGLAMSSRNERLSNDMRNRASVIYHTLSKYSSPGPDDTVKEIREAVINDVDSEEGFRTEYFEIVDPSTLQSIHPSCQAAEGSGWQGCIAVRAGDVRLIDNIRFSFPFNKG
jgi:pantoate--beta-alanine ligase